MENLTYPSDLQQLAESHGKEWGKRFGSLLVAADREFKRILPNETNRDILLKTLGNNELRELIVKRLSEGEKKWDFDAPTDTTIQKILDSKGAKFPAKPEIHRWSMLVAASASVVEGFSYGNLILSEDIVRK